MCNERIAMYLLEVVIIGQFFASHNPARTGEECHSWFSAYSPLNHLTIGLARVIDESRDSASSGVDDHLIVEAHEIVALVSH